MIIEEVIPRAEHVLYVRAADGRTGLFDVSPFLDSEAFEPLKDREAFEQIDNGQYFIAWACGADLSADTIEARWQVLPADGARETGNR
jgi:hypothetical protein